MQALWIGIPKNKNDIGTRTFAEEGSSQIKNSCRDRDREGKGFCPGRREFWNQLLRRDVSGKNLEGGGMHGGNPSD